MAGAALGSGRRALLSVDRLCLALLLFVCPDMVAAADWLAMRTTADTHLHSLDKSRLLIDGEEITYWRRVVFTQPQLSRHGQAGSALFYERLDCARHTLQMKNWLLYDQAGKLIDQAAEPDREPSPIVPDSLADSLEQTLCRMIGSKRPVPGMDGAGQPSVQVGSNGRQPEAGPAGEPVPTPR